LGKKEGALFGGLHTKGGTFFMCSSGEGFLREVKGESKDIERGGEIYKRIVSNKKGRDMIQGGSVGEKKKKDNQIP